MDADGAVLGRHDGSYGFTIGQRKGLGLDRPAADGRPRFVLSIEPVSRTVTVGPAEALEVLEIEARPAGVVGLPAAGRPGRLPGPAARPRRGAPAACMPDGDAVRISLRDPARGVAPGQAAVFYDGDAVLGSATISRADRRVTRWPPEAGRCRPGRSAAGAEPSRVSQISADRAHVRVSAPRSSRTGQTRRMGQSAWVVVLVAILLRRTTIALCHPDLPSFVG